MEARVQNIVATALPKMNYSFPLDSLRQPSPIMPYNPLPIQQWDYVTLEQAEAAHKADGERLRLVRLHAECIQRETAERAKASRLAALYQARQEDLNKDM